MLTFIPTRLVAFSARESAFAEVCVAPPPPTSTGRFSSIIRGSAGWQTIQRLFAPATFLARHRFYEKVTKVKADVAAVLV